MTLLKTTRNQTDSIRLRKFSTPIALDPTIYNGAFILGTDNKLYLSNGTVWISIVDDGIGTLISDAINESELQTANTILDLQNQIDELDLLANTAYTMAENIAIQANTLHQLILDLEFDTGNLEERVEILELAANSTLSYAIALNQAFVDSQSRYIEDQDIVDDRLIALENP